MSLCGVEQNDGVKRCQKLKRLMVTETRVTWVGALFAVQNFPDLTDFDFDKIFLVSCILRLNIFIYLVFFYFYILLVFLVKIYWHIL